MKFQTWTAVLLGLFLPALLFAQKSSISGIVLDTASFVKLPNTTVSVLNAKDSILVKFTRAQGDGSFSIKNLNPGKYILLLSYPNYADYVERFSLDSLKPDHDFGKINMLLKSKLLADVMVKGTIAAIKIKGDTTEYNAASFKVEPNAKVEDLLKQLPGIQVDKDGKITAQGQTVNKVLVDGEEFFGDDPTLVTKNLRANMVDKVQLYDKKSDQAAFTGIDDGIKTKTLNVKLKEDAKKGYFGKFDVGSLADTYYQGQGMFNAFKAKQKFSAYSTIGNTGKVGLSWEDNNKYGGSGFQVSDDGGLYIDGGGRDEFSGQYNGQGLPLARSGGMHYDTKWKSDKYSINTNYKIGAFDVDGNRDNFSQNNLLGARINSASAQTFGNSLFRQKMDFTFQVKLDSTSSLKIAFDGTLKDTKNRDKYNSSSTDSLGKLISESDRTLTNDGNQSVFNSNIFWNKKLKKKGRTVSVNLSQAFNDNDSEGFLYTTNQFFTGAKNDTINQFKTNNNKSTRLNSNITYTEPLSKTLSLVFNYGLNVNNGSNDRRSYNKQGNNYNLLDTVYSNFFELDQLTNHGGLVLNYKKNKSNLNFGTKINAVNFNQKDVLRDKNLDRDFINWLPQASYQYKFSNYRSFRASYNGNTNQPSIDQIQPVRANTDPFNITIGNQDLKPSFNSRFNMSYNSYKVISQQSLYIDASYSFTDNPIVTSITTDKEGRNVYQSINLRDKMPSNFGAYAYYYTKLQKSDIGIGFNFSVNGNTYYNYSNYNNSGNALNKTTSNNYSGGFSISKYKQKKYDFRLSFDPSYSTNESSLQKDLNNNGWAYNSRAWFNIQLPKKVSISSDASYEYREKTQSFSQNFERVLLNASVTKKFLKEDNLKFSLSGNDLLNQNVGFNRNGYSQSSYTTIKRYYLLSLVWDFNQMGVKPKPVQ